jgi:hypothetical protein
MTTDTRNRDIAVGVFHNPEDARDAIEKLKDKGFGQQDISLLMPDRAQAQEMATETGTKVGEGAATGLVAGGLLGGAAGWLVGIGALAIPGFGPFIAAGVLGAALTGAAIGAGVGAIAGALVGMGIPEDEAKYYESEVKSGRTLVTVKAGSRYGEAEDILHDHGAYDVEHRQGVKPSTLTSSTMPSTYDTTPVTPSTMDRPSSTTWETDMPRYRSRWESAFGSGGGRWEDDESAYRYGYDMRSQPEYTGRSWTDVEPTFRRDWESRYPNEPWDRVRMFIRDVWEDIREPARPRV